MIDLTPTLLRITELYKFKLSDNDTYMFFTPHDEDIPFDDGDGNGVQTYRKFPIKRGPVDYHMNLQVDLVQITMGIVGLVVDETFNYTIPQIIKNGFLREAEVTITRFDYVLLTSQTIFQGRITGDIEYTQGALRVHVGSLLDRLKDSVPNFLYKELCNHKLYGPYCKLTKADWKETGTADAGSTTSKIFDDTFLYSNQPPDWWLQGEIRFTSGDNTNISQTIVVHGDGFIETLTPFPNAVVLDDAFDCWPGCAKDGITCDIKFDNYPNNGSFEYIPHPKHVILP
ncbi:MAG: baseplate hub domain-containing protein [Planctomycetota bacterium]|jgi:uncharacterized phage protein (TIGR02218 family)